MRLSELELTNFGQHKHLLLDMDDPLVAIFGPSGVGKSIILDAIKLLLTAEVSKPPLENYIRNRGVNFENVEGLPKSATVRGVFRLENGDMEIERTITASGTRRKLKWENATYTTAEDVEKLIGELLSADRKAVSACVFPPQGELVHMLFGTQRDREELFVKLLRLSEYNAIAQHFESQAKLLEYNTQDRTLSKDHLERQRFEQESAVVEIAKSISTIPDREVELKTLDQYQQARTAWTTASAALANCESRLGELNASISGYMGSLGDSTLSTVEDLERAVQGLAQELQITQQEVQIRYHAGQLMISLEADTMALREAEAAIVRLTAEREALTARVMDPTLVATWKSQQEALQIKLKLDLEQKHAQDDLNTANAGLEKITREHAEAEARHQAYIDATKEEPLLSAYELAKLKVEMRESVTCDVPACPLCDGALNMTQLQESLPRVRQEMETAKRALVAFREERHRLSNECTTKLQEKNSWETRRVAATTLLNHVVSSMAQVQGKLPPQGTTAETLGSWVSQAEAAEAALRSFDRAAELPKAQERAVKLRGDLEKIDREALMQHDPIKLAAAKAKQPILDEKFKRYSQGVSTLRSLQGSCSELDGQRASLLARKEEAWAHFAKLQTSLGITEEDAAGIPEKMSRMLAEQKERLQLQGRLAEARTAVDRTVSELKEIADKDQQDADMKELARQLREARSVFLRQGLPLTYIRYCYQRLVDMADKNLAALDADFSISVDTETDVAMLFSPMESDSGAVFTMDRLSGGQRVRVAVAFLLALQQLVLPDLNFLTLDEPSMHLGDDVVENMADLFQSMRSPLQTAGGQIIVCDHNDLMLRAFGKVHRLTGRGHTTIAHAVSSTD